ncbi:hypothetical protein D9615_007181 [Tricholomella constricta]|uniref:Protein-S-isoprenylcysteine O-methyltransferase n=1 Tax=Tricholomella constricta TaxID=117010 RepID=A0A8H5H8I0_9AGAR|nr:hypothetical protein D9615_007181 [Tricholomella constricta]
MSALIKLPCILAVSVALHVAHTSPSKSPSTEHTTIDGMFERVVQCGTSIIKLVKGIFWAIGVAEMAAIIVTMFQSSEIDPRIASALIKTGNAEDLYLTPLSTMGAMLVVTGALVRWKCYRTLKSLFTFEVSIRKDHTLVTSWPYSVVRHPGYSGMLAVHIGMYCWCGSRGSWLRESGILDTVGGKAVVICFATLEMGVLGGLLTRMPIEDAALKKEFGLQWDEWAQKVPYALIPSVY